MPDFFGYEQKLAKGLTPTPNFDQAFHSEAMDIRSYLRSRSVEVVNTRKVFCGITSDCSYRDADGKLLLVDQEHLSLVGAREFGKSLLDVSVVAQAVGDGGQTVSQSRSAGFDAGCLPGRISEPTRPCPAVQDSARKSARPAFRGRARTAVI